MSRRSGAARALPPALCAVLCSLALAAIVHRVQLAHGLPLRVDADAHRWFVTHRQPVLTHLAIAVTSSGTGPVAYALAALAGVLYSRRARWQLRAGVAVSALLAAQVVRLTLARAVDRARPPLADWAWHATGPALPSGHTTTSAVVAAMLVAALLTRPGGPARRAACLAAVAWAVAVGVSRVYLGVHWPTDVLSGWLLALTMTLLAAGAVRATAADRAC